MRISANGRLTGFVFREGVMRSRHRLTYNKVGAIIEEPDSQLAQDTVASLDDESLDMIWSFHEMFLALRKRRAERGAIDFDSDDTRIIYDENQKIQAIVPVTRNVAHIMIEEAMLAANICSAKLLEKSGLPALFRNHEPQGRAPQQAAAIPGWPGAEPGLVGRCAQASCLSGFA